LEARVCLTALFEPAGTFYAGNTPRSVAVGDFNQDGFQDLTTIDEHHRVNVLLGNGVGGFGPAPGSPYSGDMIYLFSVAVGDFNQDTFQDLAIANDYTGGSVYLLLGDGEGGFAPGTPVPTGDSPRSVAVGDFNQDGFQDLATANEGSDNVSVLLGDGAGAFATAPGSPYSAGDGPESLAVGDFNQDGFQDLATADILSDDLSVLLGNGAGGFAPALGSPYPAGNAPKSVAVGDFNQDGFQDLATVNNAVTILLNATIGISIADVSIVEGDRGTTNAVFTVQLSRPSDDPLTLDFVTLNGTAIAGVDYENTYGSLTFLPGQTSRIIVVPIFGDRKSEGDEDFSLLITSPSDGVILNDLALATILDDDETGNGGGNGGGKGKGPNK
jgi:hypothetical protein